MQKGKLSWGFTKAGENPPQKPHLSRPLWLKEMPSLWRFPLEAVREALAGGGALALLQPHWHAHLAEAGLAHSPSLNCSGSLFAI